MKKPKKKKENKKTTKSFYIPKIVVITILFGLLVGALLMGTDLANNKALIFQYLNFLLTACILAMLIDIKQLIKKCSSKP